mmetsp:Transcript_96379/g.297196  ORF Transcript_96379/g.297196 Transcript_96379/m.297196 type:complete len:169 (+) Transcript_96379:71-577(+)
MELVTEVTAILETQLGPLRRARQARADRCLGLGWRSDAQRHSHLLEQIAAATTWAELSAAVEAALLPAGLTQRGYCRSTLRAALSGAEEVFVRIDAEFTKEYKEAARREKMCFDCQRARQMGDIYLYPGLQPSHAEEQRQASQALKKELDGFRAIWRAANDAHAALHR